MFKQSNAGNQYYHRREVSTFDSVDVQRMIRSKKWWSKKNSAEYNSILDLLGLIRVAENNMKEVKYGVLIDLYRNLYIKCNEYLDSHKGYRWTSVGRERFRTISSIKDKAQERLIPLLTTKGRQEGLQAMLVPFLTTNGTQEELEDIRLRNQLWRDNNKPVHGFGGLADIIIKTRFITESAYQKKDNLANNEMSKSVHLGKSFKISGFNICRIMQNNMTKGFHDDDVDDETNYKNMIQMRDDLLAGHESWNKSDDTPEQEENIMRNVRGLKAYKSIMFRQQKHLYNKYGKFLTQLHLYDILLRTNDLHNDAQLDQDIGQVFGAHCTANTLKELEDSFENNIKSNPILKLVFTKETEKEDRFILISYWYYGFMLFKLYSTCTFLKAGMSKSDLSENEKKLMITQKDIEKEKEVEKAAQAIGLGKMKGFTHAQKKAYLQTLKERGMDKDFKVEENLKYKEE